MSLTADEIATIEEVARSVAKKRLEKTLRWLIGTVGISALITLGGSLLYVFFVLPTTAAERAYDRLTTLTSTQVDEVTKTSLEVSVASGKALQRAADANDSSDKALRKAADASASSEAVMAMLENVKGKVEYVEKSVSEFNETKAIEALAVIESLSKYTNVTDLLRDMSASVMVTPLGVYDSELQVYRLASPAGTVTGDWHVLVIPRQYGEIEANNRAAMTDNALIITRAQARANGDYEWLITCDAWSRMSNGDPGGYRTANGANALLVRKR